MTEYGAEIERFKRRDASSYDPVAKMFRQTQQPLLSRAAGLTRDSRPGSVDTHNVVHSFFEANGKWVAVGSGFGDGQGRILASTDGRDWKSVELDSAFLFVRGDCDGDGSFGGTPTEAVVGLNFTFRGGPGYAFFRIQGI